jgi:hypothetical protein
MTATSLQNYYRNIQNILKSFIPCTLLDTDLQRQTNTQTSEVCHPRCAFKLYGEVNFVNKSQP